MAINNKDPATPPPIIGKIGPYTVFMTPPPTPSPKPSSQPQPLFDSPKKVTVAAPPVQPPPHQYGSAKSSAAAADSHGSAVLGIFKNAVTKVQNVHSSLDDHLARWFGLNQSKYQWALDDYYENKGLEKGDTKVKDMSSKMQSV